MGRYTYYCASYWHRFCEPSSVAIIQCDNRWGTEGHKAARELIEEALNVAMAEEREYCYMSADCDCDEEDPGQRCDICRADLCWSGVGAESARNLFSAKELLAHRRELLAGEVVWLERG